jgi:hypothetical protein
MRETDVLIIGAGLAGLSCARALADAGVRVRVLDRSTAVGGRCATKPPGPAAANVDFGPLFVHGDDPEFLAWVESTGVGLLPGWPFRVEGTGLPCQPQAFDPLQRRFAVPGGLRELPQALAPGLEITFGALVERLEWSEGSVTAVTASGRYSARHGVVAVALEQARTLLGTLPEAASDVVRQTDALLSAFHSLPSLTVLAEYPAGVASPPWDVWYPERSASLLVVSNEASKRPVSAERGPSLVFQARPGWSAARMESQRDDWAAALLEDAAAHLGPWVKQPLAFRSHRWRFGRVGPADHLVRPLVLERNGSTSVWGVAGDVFDMDGGLQGAWRSGRALAARLKPWCNAAG